MPRALSALAGRRGRAYGCRIVIMQPKLSSPFNLRERLRDPDSRIGVVPLASVLLVAFFLFAMTSKYVFAPGLTVDLSGDGGNAAEAPAQAEGFALPVLSGAPDGKITTSIITVRNESMFIFDGRIFRSVDAALPPAPRAGRAPTCG